MDYKEYTLNYELFTRQQKYTLVKSELGGVMDILYRPVSELVHAVTKPVPYLQHADQIRKLGMYLDELYVSCYPLRESHQIGPQLRDTIERFISLVGCESLEVKTLQRPYYLRHPGYRKALDEFPTPKKRKEIRALRRSPYFVAKDDPVYQDLLRISAMIDQRFFEETIDRSEDPN